jgi:hypothetical protein
MSGLEPLNDPSARAILTRTSLSLKCTMWMDKLPARSPKMNGIIELCTVHLDFCHWYFWWWLCRLCKDLFIVQKHYIYICLHFFRPVWLRWQSAKGTIPKSSPCLSLKPIPKGLWRGFTTFQAFQPLEEASKSRPESRQRTIWGGAKLPEEIMLVRVNLFTGWWFGTWLYFSILYGTIMDNHGQSFPLTN